MITVVTPTVGRSARRLDVLLREMRAFTREPFEQIVSDDGTPDEDAVREQEEVCQKYGAIHTRNLGPFGLPGNLNHGMGQVTTPWGYIVEDGVRPSWGWLESVLSFLRKIEGRVFEGMAVGMVGVSHLEDYVLATAGAIPMPHPDTFWETAKQQRTPEARECFYGDWNDGLWCWPRLLPGLRSTEGLSGVAKDVADRVQRDRANYAACAGDGLWPLQRRCSVAYAPGGLLLVNMGMWRDLGRFRQGCNYYEGHLGIRLAKVGHLSLWMNGPPWLHSPSQGFSDSLTHEMYRLRKVDSLHIHDVFMEDFGFKNTTAGMPLISSERHRRANDLLALIEVDAVREWDRWRRKG